MITLKKLAKELNVSISTVSKALNNSDEIGAETTLRVKALAEKYNYKPNQLALSLRQNKTRIIGVIIPDILNRFLAKVLYGIEREAANQGYHIITCISNESFEKEKASMQILANGSVDGFIICLSEETQLKNEISHFNKMINDGMPMVMFDRVANDVICDKVIVDDFEATYNTTKYFQEKGKKNIAFISHINSLSVGKLRERGYNKAMLEQKQKPLVLELNRKDDNQDKITAFLTKNKKIEVIISADNTSGTIALNTALNLGLKVPTDISIIGFASKADAHLTYPKLAIIRQHAKTIGKNATQMLINRLQLKLARTEVKTIVVKTSVIKTDSIV